MLHSVLTDDQIRANSGVHLRGIFGIRAYFGKWMQRDFGRFLDRRWKPENICTSCSVLLMTDETCLLNEDPGVRYTGSYPCIGATIVFVFTDFYNLRDIQKYLD